MHRRAVQASLALAAVLLVASLATGWLGPDATEREGDAVETQHVQMRAPSTADPQASPDQRDHAHEDDGRALEPVIPEHEHFRSGASGHVPTRAQASELEHQLRSFTVRGDEGLAEMREEGYLTGAGTLEDPYVIEAFRVREDLTIRDTSAPLVIRGSYIEGQLTLNYNGPHVYVHHNHIFDLRVNENVQRSADTTAGLFENNEVEFIGQLRHFGGTFRSNDVGPRPDGVVTTFLSDSGERPLPDDIVWNFDGYHLANVHENTVLGRVDVKLHGHFHGGCATCPAHDHADPSGFPEDNTRAEGLAPASAHSYRYHTLAFHGNEIEVEQTGIALRFYDERHAADDQTANSEPNAYLEDLHDHHQVVEVSNNQLSGGALVLDIVNAQDDRHEARTQEALFHLDGNHVDRERPRGTDALLSAYTIHAARGLSLVAEDNTYRWHGDGSSSPMPADGRWLVEGDPAETAGFLVDDANTTMVEILRTRGEKASYGVVLHATDSTFDMHLASNEFGASEEDVHHA